MSHHVVEMKAVTYQYPDGTEALHKISFGVTHGESVALVGANGAGKSTLLHHLNGLLWPLNGMVCVGDFPLTKKNIANIRRCVGMVFQDTNDQLFMPTVREDISFGPLNLGLSQSEVEERVEAALSQVESLHLIDRPPHCLSGGEKRRVAIATVLAMEPDVLVLDEPSTGLDPQSRRGIINWLRNYHRTKVIASHDLDLVLDLCPRTIILSEGKIVADGPTLKLFNDEVLLKSCRLEKPLRLQACSVCRGVT